MGIFPVAQMVKNLPATQETRVQRMTERLRVSLSAEQGRFPGDSLIKDIPAMQGMWVRSLGWEDPLEQEMATHSSVLAWRIPWTEDPGRLQSVGLQRVGHN